MVEALEVDVVGIDVGEELFELVRSDEAVGDQDVVEFGLVYCPRTFDHLAPVHERLVIGIGKADVSLVHKGPCLLHELIDAHLAHGNEGRVLGLGNRVVLAPGATHRAPQASHRQYHRARFVARQGLLLYGVKRKCRYLHGTSSAKRDELV